MAAARSMRWRCRCRRNFSPARSPKCRWRFAALRWSVPPAFAAATRTTKWRDGTRGMPWLHAFLEFPLWSEGFFRLLTSRRSIRYFLNKTWGSRDIDEGLLEYDYLTTHQPGAQHAPYYFVSGFLFSEGISEDLSFADLAGVDEPRRARRFCRLLQQDAGRGPRQLDHPGVSDRRDAAFRGARPISSRLMMPSLPAFHRHRPHRRCPISSGAGMVRTGPTVNASRFVEAAGIRWHVQRMGEGPPLLLIHGTGAATHSWRALLPLLAQHFDVIAPDLPGHGFTQSPPSHRLSLPGMAADVSRLTRRDRRQAGDRRRAFGGRGDPGAHVPRRQNRAAAAGQPQRRLHAVRRRRQSSAVAAGEIAGASIRWCRGCLPGRPRTPARSSG